MLLSVLVFSLWWSASILCLIKFWKSSHTHDKQLTDIKITAAKQNTQRFPKRHSDRAPSYNTHTCSTPRYNSDFQQNNFSSQGTFLLHFVIKYRRNKTAAPLSIVGCVTAPSFLTWLTKWWGLVAFCDQRLTWEPWRNSLLECSARFGTPEKEPSHA